VILTAPGDKGGNFFQKGCTHVKKKGIYMQLTLHSGYGLRVLIYLACHPDRFVSTHEISSAYGISLNHLVKVVTNLTNHGYVKSKRGCHGGLVLAMTPPEINIGQVFRGMEPDFLLVECFDPGLNTCPINPACALKYAVTSAGNAFLNVLDQFTLADITRDCHVQQYQDMFLKCPLEQTFTFV
jgi:Rrf2 family nitric oxide-sensitive transcriptional repressor